MKAANPHDSDEIILQSLRKSALRARCQNQKAQNVRGKKQRKKNKGKTSVAERNIIWNSRSKLIICGCFVPPLAALS
ncbi:hypothetical protein VNO78_20488 [Psophocarpus tetragonolobus]|uniref:Uncharacterized protein n=1 Tax=Psophocarpus tetragonolobus TaxID=3891 RepID=A0AAN9XH92_PSOTE